MEALVKSQDIPGPSNLYKKLAQYGIKITVGVGEAVAPSSPTEKKGEESPNSKGQDGR